MLYCNQLSIELKQYYPSIVFLHILLISFNDLIYNCSELEMEVIDYDV